jgi:hypothetical protein
MSVHRQKLVAGRITKTHEFAKKTKLGVKLELHPGRIKFPIVHCCGHLTIKRLTLAFMSPPPPQSSESSTWSPKGSALGRGSSFSFAKAHSRVPKTHPRAVEAKRCRGCCSPFAADAPPVAQKAQTLVLRLTVQDQGGSP